MAKQNYNLTKSIPNTQKIVFSFISCSLDKKESFHSLGRPLAAQLIKKLKDFENMTWGQFIDSNAKLRVAKIDNPNYDLIKSQCQHLQSKAGRLNCYHFRIGNDLFRIFGYKLESAIFYITHIDPNGIINRPSHTNR